MKLKEKLDLTAFFDAVRLCEGRVWFRTREGDCLNLKSQLSQYLFVAAWLEPSRPLDGELTCDRAEDQPLLEPFSAGAAGGAGV